MKKTTIVSLMMGFGLMATSCESDNCVDNHMEKGLSQSDAEDKCDEELVETVVVLDELR